VLVSCWSVKGGVGTTVVSAALAISRLHSGTTDVLLVDLDGDLPATLGLDVAGPGLAGWFAAGSDVPADGLARLEEPVVPGLSVLPRGDGPLDDADRAGVLCGLLDAAGRTIVVDCGLVGAQRPASLSLAATATHSLLVTRACYLALRRAQALPVRPSGVVCVSEPGRALSWHDVQQVVGAPVRAEVRVDPGIARLVDAGLLVSNFPRRLARVLRDAA